jgi:transcriptional regulator with XRE-family HTH domain
MMKVKNSFGENLKFFRKQKRLSQEELSEKVDISVKHLSAIERGLNFVSADLLEKLSLSLEIPVFFFFVNDRGVIQNDQLFDTIDRIIEKRLLGTIKDIKADIRETNKR